MIMFHEIAQHDGLLAIVALVLERLVTMRVRDLITIRSNRLVARLARVDPLLAALLGKLTAEVATPAELFGIRVVHIIPTKTNKSKIISIFFINIIFCCCCCLFFYPVSSRKANVMREKTLFWVYVPVMASCSKIRFSQ